MKVYAKATFAVGKPGDLFCPLHVIHANVIDGDVPDWAEKDLTFKNAVAAGAIEVISTKEQELAAEVTAAKAESKRKPRTV